jgi:hypothetical protein
MKKNLIPNSFYFCGAGIFKQSMGARYRLGIGFLESILGLLKSLKIRVLEYAVARYLESQAKALTP